MKANYRIIRIGKKYFPQVRFQHVVTVEKQHNIQPIHDWIYFKDSHEEDQWFNTYEKALVVCVKDSNTEVIDEIINITIDHGEILDEEKVVAV